ncbi:MAG TPA: 50S ribosomal protein L11 methyltransferase [Allosphingosinicella sp.]
MTWKLTLPCTKAEAERIGSDISPLALMDEPPTLMTSEETEESWRLDAYFEAKPGKSEIAALQALAPSSAGAKPVIEEIADQDWVTLSQQGLEPIQAGRFFVHTPAHCGSAPEGTVALEIDAGRAFGTGQHETTTGCLIALDRLKRQGFIARNLVDVGTGTGLLAFAGLRLWPGARAMASDIDPVAVEVTEENAEINAVRLGRGPGALETVTAPGLNHPRLKRRAPYDLIIANILAGPLITLAPSLSAALAPGGRLILAGLLDSQAARVQAAYRREGLRMRFAITRGDWPTLVLRRPR